MTTAFKVKNIDCANCAKKLDIEVSKIDGVKKANLVFMLSKLIVESDIAPDDLLTLIKSCAKRTLPACTVERI